MRAKRDLFRSLTLAAMVDSASRMCRGLPLPSLKVAASYIRTYDGRDNLRAARTPKYVSFPLPCGRYRFVIVWFSSRSWFPVPWSDSVEVRSAFSSLGRSRLFVITPSPPSSPSSSSRTPAGKPRTSAAQRRLRQQRKIGPLVLELQGKLSALRSKLQATQDELRAVKADRSVVVGEHRKLADEITRLLKLADKDRQCANVQLVLASVDARANTTDAVRFAQAKLLSKQKLEGAKSAACLQDLHLEIKHLKELAGRLRLERDTARADALRYNKERNDLREEVASLRTAHSTRIVKAATAVRVKFPGLSP